MAQKKTNEVFLQEVNNASPNVDLLEHYVNSVTPLLCRCKSCGHTWKAHPRFLLNGINCPNCGFKLGGKLKAKTHTEFIRELQQISPNITVLDGYINARTKVSCKCNTCGYNWKTTPNSLLRGSGCKRCAGLLPWTTDEFKKSVEQSGTVEVLGEYVNNREKVLCRCKKCGYDWYGVPSNLLRGHGCPKCGNALIKTDEDFRHEAEKNKNQDVEILGRYVTSNIPIKCRCKVCGREWHSLPQTIIRGHGCAKCAGVTRRENEEFIRKLELVDASIEPLDEYINSATKIRFKCQKCGSEWQATPANVLIGHGCRRCSRASTSYMEQYVYSALVKVFGEGQVKSRSKSAIGKELDIYLPNYRLAIEIGAWFWHKNRINNDILKQQLCQKRGIRLLSIYDTCGTDAVPPFPDSKYFSHSLAAEENHKTLRQIITLILSTIKYEYEFTDDDWDKIESDATMFSKRKGIEEYRMELLNINPEIEIIGTQIKSGSQLRCRCKECGYEWDGYLGNLLRGSRCRKCLGLLKKTTEQFVQEAREKNSRVEVIGEYRNDDLPVMCKCKLCGNIWETRAHNVLKGTACPLCKGKRIAEARRKPPEQFLEEINARNAGYEVLEPYINAYTKINCKCNKCGTIWLAKPTDLLKGTGCPNCKGERISESQRKSIETFKQEMYELAPNIEIIGEYINNKTNIRCRCRSCGYEWEGTPSNLLKMTRNNCRNCQAKCKRQI